MKYPIYWPEFYTASILEWKHLLKPNKYKDLLIDSLHFMVLEKMIKLYAFVLMSNHMHLIWQALQDKTPEKIQHSLLSFTAKKIKDDLEINHPLVLPHFKVNVKDREYQIWERNSLGVELYSPGVFMQ